MTHLLIERHCYIGGFFYSLNSEQEILAAERALVTANQNSATVLFKDGRKTGCEILAPVDLDPIANGTKHASE